MEKLLRTIILLSFLAGCSTATIKEKWNALWEPSKNESTETKEEPKVEKRIVKKREPRPDRLIKPYWFTNIPSMYFLYDDGPRIPIHPFYDVPSHWRSREQLINYVEISPEASSYQYDLDMVSGKLYKVRDNCGTEDLWKSYMGKIEKPNFSLGIVPQTYNQQKSPQKIIIFKDEAHSDQEPFSFVIREYAEARVIGSVILEHCEEYPCNAAAKWKPTQILVGVDAHDQAYSEIKNLADLQREINWPYAKAFLANQYGVHNLAKNFYPAYRITTEYNFESTKKYFDEKSSSVNFSKLLDFRKACFFLYDTTWDRIKRIRTFNNSQRESFFDMFKSFYFHESDQYYACQKLIRPASINEDPDRNWFFAYVSAFMHLEQSGYYFDCKEGVWVNNPRIDRFNFLTSELKELRSCTVDEFESIFDKSTNAMVQIKNQLNKYFRYIEYDSQHGGSHQKIYSWVPFTNMKLPCDKEESFPELFPQDVFWKPFKVDEPKNDNQTDQPYSKY